MKKIFHHPAIPVGIVASICGVTFAIMSGITGSSVYAASTNPAPDTGRLVIIHDRNEEKGILTHGETIGDALREADIHLDDHDVVEPGVDEKLVATKYSVNIYRARPVIVVDGAIRQKIMTSYQSADKIAVDAGIDMHDEDKAELVRSDDIIGDGAAVKMVIKRATAFTLELYGTKKTAYTMAKTVGEMMDSKHISLAADDTLSVDRSTPITAGMVVEIWRNGKQTATEEQEVPFGVQQIQDADHEVGYKQVQTPGVKGKRTVSYEIEVKNGKEVSRKEIQSVVTQQPKTQVEIVGAKQKSFGGNCATWMAGAGITDISNATYLINRESHCNPYAVNKSSGACGIGQALPCSKTGCEMGDGACQMRWMNSYVMGRYGSWAAAAAHSRQYGWY